MEQILKKTVQDIVRNDHRAAAVFEKYSIDFCCGGNKTLDAACAQNGIDPAVVHRELEGLTIVPGGDTFRPDEWDLGVLADYIVKNHHRYVRRALPLVNTHLDKIVTVHGKNHPELSTIAGYFRNVEDELTRHMQKEEMILFPFIKVLAAAQSMGMPPRPPFGTIRNPIRMMEAEHQSAGNSFSHIRNASGDYTPPPDACDTYRVTFKELQDFERDLHLHIHLENNILFPKAITLEDAVFS